MITLTNLHLQSASGLFVPFGSVSFSLNIDGTVLAAPGGFVSADIPIIFQLDANGNLIQPAKLYSNAELTPQNSQGLGSTYAVTFYDQNNARLNKSPMIWQFNQAAGSTVDISMMIPFSSEGTVIFYPTSFPIIAPTLISLGGVFANAGAAHEWVSAINSDGTATFTQPSFADISGTLTAGQLPSPLTFTSIVATTILASGLITAQANIFLGVIGTTSGQISLAGGTSGQATITAPAVAGTVTNPIIISNSVSLAATCILAAPGGVTIGAGTTITGQTGTGPIVAMSVSPVFTGTISAAALTATGLITGQANIQLGLNGTTAGAVILEGGTSGSCAISAPAVAGTNTNPISISNSISLPVGTVYAFSTDTGLSRIAAGVIGVGNGTAGNFAGTVKAAIFQGGQQDSVAAFAGTTDALPLIGSAFITTAGVDATTLATPTVTTDDGKTLTVVDTTGHAHTITTASGKIVPAHSVVTFNGTVGSFVTLRAFQGLWYPLASNGVTFS
jgi:hypothetical protein